MALKKLLNTAFLAMVVGSLLGQNPFINPSFETTSSVAKNCQGNCPFPDNWQFDDCNSEGALCRKTQSTDGSYGVGVSWTGNTGCCTVYADIWQNNVDLSGICEIAVDRIGPGGGNPERSDHYLYIDGTQVKDCGYMTNSDTNTCYLDVSAYTGNHTFRIQWNQRSGDNLGNSVVDHVRVTSSESSAPTGASASPNPNCGGNTTLSVNGGSLGVGADWEWYTGSCGGTSVGSGGSISVSPTTNSTYYVRGENSCNITSCASVTVTVASASSPPSGVTANPDTICAGDTSTLTKNGGSLGSGASWEWYSGTCGGTAEGTGTSIDVHPGSTKTYYVRAEGTCDTTNCANIQLVVSSSSSPVTSASATPSKICKGDTTTLSKSGGSLGSSAYWIWYTNSCGGSPEGTGPSIDVHPIDTTTYYIRAEGSCGNTACDSTTVNVDQPSAGPLSITATPNPVCPGDSTKLTINGGSLGTGGTWEWYSGSCGGSAEGSGGILKVAPSSNTTYFVRAEGNCDTTSCASGKVSTSTTSSAPSSASVMPGTICAGDTATLTKSGGSLASGGAWEWYKGSCGGTPVGTGSTIKTTPTSNTSYFVRAEDDCDTTGCVTTSINVLPSPNVDAGLDRWFCRGDTIQLGGPTVSGGTTPYTISWSNDTDLSDGSVLKPKAFPDSTTYFKLTVTDANGCSESDSLKVTVYDNPKASFSGLGGPYCGNVQGDTLFGSKAPEGYFFGKGVTDLNNGKGYFDPYTAPAGTNEVYYRFNDSNNCFVVDTQTVVLHEAPEIEDKNLISIQATCGMSNGSIENMNIKGGTTPYTYLWRDASGNTVSSDLDLTQQPTGDYSLLVIDSNGCRDSAGLYFIGEIGGPSADAGSDTIFCEGGSTTLGGKPSANGGTAPYSYRWRPRKGLKDTTAENPEASPPVSTSYTLTVRDTNDCKARDTVRVRIWQKPDLNAGGTIKSCARKNPTLGGEPTSRGAGPPFSYTWSNASTLSSDSVPNPVSSTDDSTSYSLAVSDTNGCIAYDTARVLMDDRHCAGPHIFIPNAFSPNADGTNDKLYVKGKDIARFKLVIYDRWGQKMFSTSSKDKGWDGTFNDKPLDPAVFVYKVTGRFETGEKIEKKGNITLLK